ncbi:hypothetical protein B0A48_06775 [Cryoendolithus antarcticus]|uniref:DNA polymerase n=1 Tax=Cryoendolithus antarcticus TaxID=1507870 RepID=A0A1V8T9W2_9PEZI|nr:hypothetical protein B0A48_06775 [Cryoendolithus antarcticus]
MAPSRAERQAALAKLKAARAGGTTAFDAYQVEEAKDVYETVDDEGYKKVVRERLDQDDFVVDDNGAGYADDGREDWQEERQAYDESESEGDLPTHSKAAKRKREDEDADRQDKLNKGINKYFSKNAIPAASKPKPTRTVEDDDFMAGLLGEVDANVPSKAPSYAKAVRSGDRRKTRVLSPPLDERRAPVSKSRHNNVVTENSAPAYEQQQEDDDAYFALPTEDDVVMSDPLPSSPAAKAGERKEQVAIKVEAEEDDLMEVAQVTGHANIRTANVNLKGSKPMPKLVTPASYPTPDSSSPTRAPVDDIDMAAINNVTEKLHILSSPQTATASVGKLAVKDAVEEDGSLRFFWTDYTEVNGSLCLFGKVKDKSNGSYVSSFVKIDNIDRKLFFLPREYRQRHGRDTAEEVKMEDVYEEVDKLMTKSRVGLHRIKGCKRKYAFELPGIPKEADYLKLLYSYDKPALPMDLKGETFSHVFGTNTALFEQFVMWKNIMGPCWLKIDGGDFTAVNNASWCKVELQVDRPDKNICTLGDTDNLDVPPLTLMSLALRTTMNTKENKNEILVANLRFYESISLTDTTSPEKLPSRSFTIMRPNGKYPVGFKEEVSKHRGSVVSMEPNEAAVLSKLLAIIQKYDPDAIMGHKLDDVDYNTLLTRLRERKTPGWHRIGRLKRGDWPKNVGKGGGSFYAERHLAAGRLLCDIANDMGKSIMTGCQSWSLDEMVSLHLGGSNKRKEIDSDKALAMATTAPGLVNYIKLCEADTYFVAALALKRQLLPLTKVLTNLAGNSWARTLSGTRAERNEYILLHEFSRNKYICPDKVFGKGASNKKIEEENPEGAEAGDVKKKDKYKGGLVFEPEKGLYDKFILVMDFNSLYPSIIQEYNICFTTIERSGIDEDDDKVPDVPENVNDKGILPRLISTLVARRREVKKLMKAKDATEDQKATWDVKQMALKLTANSMYGCLGYTKSRFYARPLAALTTSKGREILRDTKALAEGQHALRVIYGDTDSVMVNTNQDNIIEALKMAKDFQKTVNEKYTLLEIELDHIFRRLLLHAKKKYAAITMTESDGVWKEKMDVKGLDMKRREYCQLSKETSEDLLKHLLSGDDPEKVVQEIHEYLRALSARMRDGAIPSHKYTIYTQLGKDPKDYPAGGSMASVQVALKMIAKGKPVRAKDVMSFVICGTSNGSAETAAKNAQTLDEVLAKDSGLLPDIDYYLHKQILPPVERLCAPISGTNVTLLAECLGLDTTKYRVSNAAASSSAHNSNEITTLESQIPNHIRFNACESLSLLCLSCRQPFQFRGLAHTPLPDETPSPPLAIVTNNGLCCPHSSCSKPMTTLTLSAQLQTQIRQHTSRYYAAWLQCDDAACTVGRTRQMSVYGHRCLGPKGLAYGCSGRMAFEYSEKALYNQLLFLQSMFDVEKAIERLDGKSGVKVEEGEKRKVLAGMNRERFAVLEGIVKGLLERSGWGWSSEGEVFGLAVG